MKNISNIVFLDTETTGNEPAKDFLCQLAYKTKPASIQGSEVESQTFCELFKPPLPIPPEASAVTHITNKMVADKKAFQESESYNDIKSLLEAPTSVMVAHNAKFDLAIIAKEGIVPAQHICTLRVARALDKNNVIPQYKLQYLRYYLEIDIEADAHDALGDVLVLEKLFERLYAKVLEEIKKDPLAFTGTPPSKGGEEMQVLEKMIEISSKPSLMNSFAFGKYNGKTLEEVNKIDPGYLDWMLTQKEQNPDNEEDWIYSLKYYLGKLV